MEWYRSLVMAIFYTYRSHETGFGLAASFVRLHNVQ